MKCILNSLLRKLILNSVLVYILSTAFAHASALDAWTPLSAYRYKTSLHSLALSEEENFVKRMIPAACLQSIRQVLDNGGDFRSRELRALIKPIREHQSADTRDGEFFHYTNSTEVTGHVITKNLEELFSYFRIHGKRRTGELYFYIAEDPRSSASMGQYRIVVKLPETALMYHPAGLTASRDANLNTLMRDLQKQIDRELSGKYPEVRPCEDWVLGPGEYRTYSHFHSVLTSFAIEAEGVSLISYFGLQSSGNWYQVAGPWVLDDIQFVK